MVVLIVMVVVVEGVDVVVDLVVEVSMVMTGLDVVFVGTEVAFDVFSVVVIMFVDTYSVEEYVFGIVVISEFVTVCAVVSIAFVVVNGFAVVAEVFVVVVTG